MKMFLVGLVTILMIGLVACGNDSSMGTTTSVTPSKSEVVTESTSITAENNSSIQEKDVTTTPVTTSTSTPEPTLVPTAVASVPLPTSTPAPVTTPTSVPVPTPVPTLQANQISSEDHAHSASTPLNLFLEGALASETTSEICTLSDGTEATCYRITIAGFPSDNEVGPFCPATTSTSADEAGIWIDGDALYHADGDFIVSLAEIYDDDKWMLYNDDGTVNVTDTREAFEAAARPDVDEAYQNYCVEGRIEWLDNGEPIETTVLIPSTPVSAGSSSQISGKIGVTFNGVIIDPSAPVGAILGAYTIAAFDDCGGHLNPFDGYHLHAATGCSEVGEADAGETKAFAYALDGYMIHSPYTEGEEPSDLDTCNGHTTDKLGYHYHANQAAENAVLNCFMGEIEISNAGRGAPGGNDPPGGNAPPGGNGLDLSEAAEKLGITKEELSNALGGPPPDFEAAAKILGLSVEELMQAIPRP